MNDFVGNHAVRDVIEFGCGDGNQLTLARYPAYRGYDISQVAVQRCRVLFEGDSAKSFATLDAYDGALADLALSFDVIYHLVEDDVFETYMSTLFRAARRYVVIYSSDSEDNTAYSGTWIRQHRFTEWIQANRPEWQLVQRVKNPYPLDAEAQTDSWADFFVYVPPTD